MDQHEKPRKFSGGEVTVWVDNGTSIMLRSVTPHGDPVELNAEEARELAEYLLACAAQIE